MNVFKCCVEEVYTLLSYFPDAMTNKGTVSSVYDNDERGNSSTNQRERRGPPFSLIYYRFLGTLFRRSISTGARRKKRKRDINRLLLLHTYYIRYTQLVIWGLVRI